MFVGILLLGCVSNIFHYEYDDLGRLTKLTSPDTGIDVFTYDEAGNVLSKLDANGNTTSFTYDNNNRPTSIDYAGTDLDTTFIYDQNPNGINQLTTFFAGITHTALSYDAFGNLLNKTQAIKGGEFEIITPPLTYTYDNNNRIQTITYPSGLIVTYHYNNLNQTIKLTTTLNGTNIDIVNNVQYLPMGPAFSMDIGNGLQFSSNYDNGYRLEDYQYSAILSGNYSYDDNHNITTITRESANNNGSYTYDNLDRIIVENSLPNTYTYDKLGNRTSFTDSNSNVQNYQYDANSNKLTKISTQKARSYDNNGNTLNTNTWDKNFVYNTANRMARFSVGKNQVRAKYYYNGIGQRVYKIRFYNNAELQHHIYQYNASGQLLHDSNYNNSTEQNYAHETIWLGNKPVAQVRTQYSQGNITATAIYYILSDHLNTPRKVTDSTGTVLWSWNSDAFGTTPANEDVDADNNNFEFNLRFPGQYFDKESGIHYNYFRDYEPGTGRYLQSDPIGLEGGWNTFGYVGGDPVSKYDFYGLFDFSLGGGRQFGFGGGEFGVIQQDCCRNGQVIRQFFRYYEGGPGFGASAKFGSGHSFNFSDNNKKCTVPKPSPWRIHMLIFSISAGGVDVGWQFGFSGRWNIIRDVEFWYEVERDLSCCDDNNIF